MVDLKSQFTRILKVLDPMVDFVKNLRIQKDFHVFVAFLLLSTFFWLIKALNKEYEYTINYPVSYEKIPDNIVLEKEQPQSIELKIKDTGFQLLRYSSRRLVEVDLSVRDLLNRPGRRLNNNHAFFLTRDYEREVRRNLMTTTALLGISPDTLHVRYARQVSKRVPIRLKGRLEPAQQRILNGDIRIIPDSIAVYGPENILDTISYIYTLQQDFVKLKDTLVRNIALDIPDHITISKKRVNVVVPVEMFTEKTLEVPVRGLHFPDSLRLRTFPGMVSVSFFVGISRFQEIDAHLFEASVDYALISSGVSGNVPVSIRSDYKYISNLRVVPENVVYLIELKDKTEEE